MPSLGTLMVAPDYSRHRHGLTAADAAPITNQASGFPAAGFQSVHVQVVPTGGDPSVEVLFWSPAAGRFISEHVPITKAGKGVGVPYEFTVETKGRRIFIKLSTLAAGTCDIWLSAWNP